MFTTTTQNNAKTFKIFIGCVPGKTTDEEICSLFKEYKSIKELHLERRKNNKCSGYGHMMLSNEEEYEALVKKKHFLGERQLTVMPYLEKRDLIDSQLSFNKRRIVIAGLPNSARDKDLFDHFSKFGAIEKAFVVKNTSDPDLKPYAHVIFKDSTSATLAKNKNHYIKGKKVQIKTHKIDLDKKLKTLGTRKEQRKVKNEASRMEAKVGIPVTPKKKDSIRLLRKLSGDSASKLSRSFIALSKTQIQKDILRLSKEIHRSNHHDKENVRFNKTDSMERRNPFNGVDVEDLDIAYLSSFVQEHGRYRQGMEFSLF